MIKIENVSVHGFEEAIRGMRNPMNSWDKSDSGPFNEVYDDFGYIISSDFAIGPNDLNLAKRLANLGPVYGKYRRMITVYMDIIAPLYWWKEFDTYKVGTVANSCSTMHKIADKEFTLDDFSHEHLDSSRELTMYAPKEYRFSSIDLLKLEIEVLNHYRQKYLEVKKIKGIDDAVTKDIWWQMIQLLPSSYNQKRTVMMNYEVLSNIYRHRVGHKLDEWVKFCKVVKDLPYAKELIVGRAGV